MNAAARHFIYLVLGVTGLACLLGICLDLVTANVAVEYFSVHHPRILETENPWLLALVWGVGASWWFGALAGIVVAFINQRRKVPLPRRRILKWTAIACALLWLLLITILVSVFALASTIPEDIRRPSFESDRRLMAVAMAQQFEYLLGGIALLVIGIKTWRAS